MKISPPNYTQTPNELFDYWLPHLKEGELKVLLVIMRKTFGWHKTHDEISISQLSKLTGMREETVAMAAKSLQNKGVINRQVIGPIGQQKTIYSLIVQENSNNSYPSDNPRGPLGFDGGGKSEAQKKEKKKKEFISIKGTVLTVSNNVSETPKTLENIEKTLPFSREKIRGKHFPLKKHQRELFEQMEELNLGTDDETLRIIIRTAEREGKLENVKDAINHFKSGQDDKIKDRIAFFRSIVNGDIVPICENTVSNSIYAMKAKESGKWFSLNVSKKFVRCDYLGTDLSLNRPPEEFKFQLKKMFDMYKHTKE